MFNAFDEYCSLSIKVQVCLLAFVILFAINSVNHTISDITGIY